MTSSQVSLLIAEILAAEDEAGIVDLLVRDANAIAELPPRERERANERIADAIREHREVQRDLSFARC
jgi:acyl-CoA reductase-like NAD-dependent aldehyde dehydrogenase